MKQQFHDEMIYKSTKAFQRQKEKILQYFIEKKNWTSVYQYY